VLLTEIQLDKRWNAHRHKRLLAARLAPEKEETVPPNITLTG